MNYASIIILCNILRTIVCTSDIGRTLKEKNPHRITDAQTKQLTAYSVLCVEQEITIKLLVFFSCNN